MIIILGFLTVCIVLLFLYGYFENYHLKTERYELKSEKLKKPLTLVFLTDLHANEHGRDNYQLFDRICKIEPDIICITGDMVVKNNNHTERVLAFMEKLGEKYPVYYSPGNHEIRLEQYDEYKKNLKDRGIFYLENQSVTLSEYNVNITGLDLPEFWYHKVWDKRVLTAEALEEFIPFDKEESVFHLLLAHNPEYFPAYGQWGADLTLCGHIHGGIAILPFLGGVLSPSLRLFPKYDQGLKKENGRYLLISRGLGLHHIKFRFFNRPELSVINLSCQVEKK